MLDRVVRNFVWNNNNAETEHVPLVAALHGTDLLIAGIILDFLILWMDFLFFFRYGTLVIILFLIAFLICSYTSSNFVCMALFLFFRENSTNRFCCAL
jgi:hypothetical protein